MTTFARSIIWEDGTLRILDQTKLPKEEHYLLIKDLEQAAEAILKLRVRGAPAISLFAAFVLVLEAKKIHGEIDTFKERLRETADILLSTRPTAVNLQNILEELGRVLEQGKTVDGTRRALERRAIELYEADAATSRQIGEHSLSLFEDGAKILTICNAGSIATAAYGTALAPFYLAKERGIRLEAFASETRPLLQGARLTTWELQRAGIPVTLITDNMAAYTIQQKGIDAIIVGADRITRNGDTANKIGTFQLALLARSFGIPFYVAAPLTTFDFSSAEGSEIEIEERPADEVLTFGGTETAPRGVDVFNPAFDVTPHSLITAIITELGVIETPNERTIAAALGALRQS
ncbi:S-methyl-5-thioribose-1-phosphate isomerase [Exiguobacterium flavidum]|uniref:S-methyl-5-thioribose-1-phosphate isomerase n=1 Tax=Exiguobacterium flavidum TaxID=2184695 RepID=UPI000DF81FFB|nr:S-methyl-5-thioribose-1-phosphate isomerase [Exiguobacterium flavidum]